MSPGVPGEARKVLQGDREVDTGMATVLRGPSQLLSHPSDQEPALTRSQH